MMNTRSEMNRDDLRLMAREAAQGGRAPKIADLSDDEVGQLLYEFGVYQSELQAQNDELLTLRAVLEAERDNYRELYDFAPVGFMTLDAEGTITEANLTVCELLGKYRKEVMGSRLESYLVENHQKRLRDHLESVIVNDRVEDCEVDLLRKKEGGVVHLRLQARPKRREQDKGLETLVAVMDETVSKRIRNDLIRARQQADSANCMKSEFLANMSHEIRTPLGGIHGMLQVLRLTELTNQQDEYVSLCQGASTRLNHLISDILDLSRIEVGKLSLENKLFDLGEMMQSLEQMFQVAAREAGLALRFYLNPSIPRGVVGDSFRLRQVLNNFIGNAIKFTDAGTIEVEAHPLPAVHPGTQRILFSVSDTGIGMTDEALDKLFVPFTQQDSGMTREHQGAGLGLSICKQLVAAMNGHITVSSELGKGTQILFSATFGLSEPLQEMKFRSETKRHSQPVKRSILLVEDDLLNRQVTICILEKYGYVVTAVGDGEQALKSLRDNAFDLVLMDVQLPVMDGMEATRLIRSGDAGAANKGIPIIALTAFAMMGDREKFLNSGMDDYVVKPVEIDDLLGAVNRVMEDER